MNNWRPAGIVKHEYPSPLPDSILEAGTGDELSVTELLARYNVLLLDRHGYLITPDEWLAAQLGSPQKGA